jgi:prophage tail gpP-like protein
VRIVILSDRGIDPSFRIESQEMSFLSSVENTTARRQSEYFSGNGSHLVEITDCKLGKNRKGREFIVVETKVLDSNDGTPKGAERSWLMMTDADTTAKNFRAFLVRALNVADSALTGKEIEKAITATKATGRSPLAGLKIQATCQVIKTKAGSDFTLINWVSVDQNQTSL